LKNHQTGKPVMFEMIDTNTWKIWKNSRYTLFQYWDWKNE